MQRRYAYYCFLSNTVTILFLIVMVMDLKIHKLLLPKSFMDVYFFGKKFKRGTI